MIARGNQQLLRLIVLIFSGWALGVSKIALHQLRVERTPCAKEPGLSAASLSLTVMSGCFWTPSLQKNQGCLRKHEVKHSREHGQCLPCCELVLVEIPWGAVSRTWKWQHLQAAGSEGGGRFPTASTCCSLLFLGFPLWAKRRQAMSSLRRRRSFIQ